MRIVAWMLPILSLMMLYSSAFANDPTAKSRDRLAYLSSIAPGAKIACANDRYGNAACTADGYQIDFGDCSDRLSYGGIATSGGVSLEDQVSSRHAQPVARLQDKQLVCIEATARRGEQERAFVKAVPVESVPGCKGNDLCRIYGDRPVEWMRPPPGKSCRRTDGKAYTGDCAAGWIDMGTLEEFSMGL
jgi:hypothetical protein